jgi:hypothetical protein
MRVPRRVRAHMPVQGGDPQRLLVVRLLRGVRAQVPNRGLVVVRV